jgi:hypothetical protein
MVAECDEEIEEEGAASVEHLQLHRATTLEGAATADDEGEIVSSQLRVCLWSVGVCVSGRSQDRAGLNTGFCTCLVSNYP